MTMIRGVKVEGTHYDFVGKKENITRVKKVIRVSEDCLWR